jgi:hypothetical protein
MISRMHRDGVCFASLGYALVRRIPRVVVLAGCTVSGSLSVHPQFTLPRPPP